MGSGVQIHTARMPVRTAGRTGDRAAARARRVPGRIHFVVLAAGLVVGLSGLLLTARSVVAGQLLDALATLVLTWFVATPMIAGAIPRIQRRRDALLV